jgi:hypothetical protein
MEQDPAQMGAQQKPDETPLYENPEILEIAAQNEGLANRLHGLQRADEFLREDPEDIGRKTLRDTMYRVVVEEVERRGFRLGSASDNP